MRESPEEYKKSAIMAQEAGLELLSRLDLMKLFPATILDVACRTDDTSKALKERYPDATIISMDWTESALTYPAFNDRDSRFLSKSDLLPLRAQSIDLIFANFCLPWQKEMSGLLAEWQRVLSPQGVILLSALGLETLTCYGDCLNLQLIDMHDLGDLLIQTDFRDPVLDVCHYTVTYQSYEKMRYELMVSGMLSNETSLTSPLTMPCELKYEVIFAHAFKLPATKEGETKIPLSVLRSSLKIS